MKNKEFIESIKNGSVTFYYDSEKMCNITESEISWAHNYCHLNERYEYLQKRISEYYLGDDGENEWVAKMYLLIKEIREASEYVNESTFAMRIIAEGLKELDTNATYVLGDFYWGNRVSVWYKLIYSKEKSPYIEDTDTDTDIVCDSEYIEEIDWDKVPPAFTLSL